MEVTGNDTHTVAYYGKELITAVKRFIVLTAGGSVIKLSLSSVMGSLSNLWPGANVIKLFTNVSYEFL